MRTKKCKRVSSRNLVNAWEQLSFLLFPLYERNGKRTLDTFVSDYIHIFVAAAHSFASSAFEFKILHKSTFSWKFRELNGAQGYTM